jgi:gluconokinase
MMASARVKPVVVLALDIGTSQVRAFAYDDDLVVRAGSSRPVSTYTSADGASWQSWPELHASVFDCISEITAAATVDVKALVLSGTASCFLPSWGDGSEAGAGEVVLWSDTRASAEQREIASAVKASYDRTLCPSHATYWPAKLRWFERHRSHIMGTVRIGGAKDRLFDLFSGEWWTDPMTAAATGVFDSSVWRWDEELLSASGIRDFQLPQVREATDQAPLGAEPAAAIGLPCGLPVVVGGMDGPLAQLGAAGWDETVATCTVGTSIAYRAASARRTPDPTMRTWSYPVSRTFWVMGGAGSNGGNVISWLQQLTGDGALGDLVRDALSLSPDPQLLFLPYLFGERSPLWRDDLRAAIVGLGAHHGQLDIIRAALDGIAAATQELAEAVSAQVPRRPAGVRLTGGFLQENSWAQLVTDALGMPTAVPDPKEATATGAAVLGWLSLGVGAPADLLSARCTDERNPDMAVHEVLTTKGALLRSTRGRLFADQDAVSSGGWNSSMTPYRPA